MKSADLGFDDWFSERASALLNQGGSAARVTAVDRDAFLVRDGDGEIYAELAGKFRFSVEAAEDFPCVGDWVCVRRRAHDGPALIEAVLPRKTLLRRKHPGRIVEFQMIAANIEAAFVVQACGYDFNLKRLDRYLAMAREGGIEPWIILTKTDLVSPAQLEQAIGLIGQVVGSPIVLALSNMTGAGLREFRALLAPGRTYCLIGSSGVGKTTLVNRLIGRDALNTGAVSGSGEGVHTTTRRQLLVIDNGAMLIDTPGMRELGLLGADDGVDDAFGEIRKLAEECRFANCTHRGEPGCAVLLAVGNGVLSKGRIDSYLKLKKETEHHDLSYYEKRRKEKSFGRFIKAAGKSMKRAKA